MSRMRRLALRRAQRARQKREDARFRFFVTASFLALNRIQGIADHDEERLQNVITAAFAERNRLLEEIRRDRRSHNVSSGRRLRPQ